MKYKLIFILIFSVSIDLKAQSEVTIKGVVLDSLGSPIFSTILTQDHAQGTHSDINGQFILRVAQLPVSLEITSVCAMRKKNLP